MGKVDDARFPPDIAIIGGRFIRDSHIASNQHFRPSPEAPFTEHYAGVPRSKFLFGVRFFRALGENTRTGSGSEIVTLPGQRYTYGSKFQDSVSFAVKSIDRPKLEFDVDVLNQYNKPRLVNTKVKFQPVNLRFYDTVDDRALLLFQDYFSHYFGDGRKQSLTEFSNDVISEEWNDVSNTGWGFAPIPGRPGNSQYFFSHIDIYHFYGGRYNTITLVHPKIMSFDHDTNDYAQTNDISEIGMTLVHEGIIYSKNQVNVNESGIATPLGIDSAYSDYYEYRSRRNSPKPTIINKDQFRRNASVLQRQTSPADFFAPPPPTTSVRVFGTASVTNSALSTQGQFTFQDSQLNNTVSFGVRIAAEL